MQNQYIVCRGGQALRRGWTTGTCAAAAAGAAAELLLTGRAPAVLRLDTPAGIAFDLPVEQPHRDGDAAVCTVRKDAGDDPDITDGVRITAAVRRAADGVTIDGGAGVGRVTRPGLAMPVGAAAINPGPRAQIAAALGRAARPRSLRARGAPRFHLVPTCPSVLNHQDQPYPRWARNPRSHGVAQRGPQHSMAKSHTCGGRNARLAKRKSL